MDKWEVTFVDGNGELHCIKVLAHTEEEAEEIATEKIEEICMRKGWDVNDFEVCACESVGGED